MSKINSKRLLLAITTLTYSLSALPADNSGSKIKWGYEDNIGPSHWGQLDPNFITCSTGKLQSPINISNKVADNSNKLMINYQPSPMIIVDNGTTNLIIGNTQTIFNDGHTIQLNFSHSPSTESIILDKKHYQLIQFHLHTPSENQLNTKSFPLEIHFVHQDENGTPTVIGVFVKAGKANPMIQKIINNSPKNDGQPKSIKNQRINPADLLPVKQDHYTFAGSLTTPPCTEGVKWIMMKNAITASPEQIAKIENDIGGANSRPVQALNNRKISYSNK